MTAPLYMLHVPVRVPELARFAYDRSWTTRRRTDGREMDAGFDEGRALHHLLDETFGQGILRPFRMLVAPGARGGSIYAYTRDSGDELLATARETGPPEASRILSLERLRTQPMPDTWTVGRRFGFDVRIRPIVRLKTPLGNPRRPEKPYRSGAELDAFFVEAQRDYADSPPRIVDGEPIASGMLTAGRTREVVYRDWLAARMGKAVQLDGVKTVMRQFCRTRVARKVVAGEGPDAVFHGELTIADPAAFGALLAGGVGRHKAYGYGMLLLRPIRRRAMER